MKYLDINGLGRFWAKVKAFARGLPADADFASKLANSETFVSELTEGDRFLDWMHSEDGVPGIATATILNNPILGPEWAKVLAILISQDADAASRIGGASACGAAMAANEGLINGIAERGTSWARTLAHVIAESPEALKSLFGSFCLSDELAPGRMLVDAKGLQDELVAKDSFREDLIRASKANGDKGYWEITNAIEFLSLPLLPGANIMFNDTPATFFGVQCHPEKYFPCAVIGDLSGVMLVRVQNKIPAQMIPGTDIFGLGS